MTPELARLLFGGAGGLTVAAQQVADTPGATSLPAAADAPDRAAAREANRKLMEALANKRGRASTIMTGPLGISSKANLQRPILSSV